MIRKVRLDDVEEPVRAFLDDALSGDGLIIEGAGGQLRGRVLAYELLSSEEQDRAWREHQVLQAKVQQRLDAQGESEAELDAILQEDD